MKLLVRNRLASCVAIATLLTLIEASGREPAPAAPVPPRATAPVPAPTRDTALRCGRLENPTPANWFLVDRDGEWILGMQGGYQAPELDDLSIPNDSKAYWVVTNFPEYGYACGCLRVQVDPKTRQITHIRGRFQQKPIRVCRADKNLPAPPDPLPADFQPGAGAADVP